MIIKNGNQMKKKLKHITDSIYQSNTKSVKLNC